MKAGAFARQGPLPVSVNRHTGALLSLAEWRADPDVAADPAKLSLEEQIALVRARWQAGAWHDMIYGTEGEVDLERAVRELEARSEMGRHLLAIGLRAIEMACEDAAEAEQG